MLAHHVISHQLFLLARNDLARVYVDYTGSSISKRGLCFGRSLVAWAFLQWCHSLFHVCRTFVEQLLVTGGLLYGFPERQRLDWFDWNHGIRRDAPSAQRLADTARLGIWSGMSDDNSSLQNSLHKLFCVFLSLASL